MKNCIGWSRILLTTRLFEAMVGMADKIRWENYIYMCIYNDDVLKKRQVGLEVKFIVRGVEVGL